MKRFVIKRKNFTIPEGHFTGQKDMDEVPSLLHNAGKGMLWGSSIGAVAGGVMGHFDDNSTMIGGALDGSFQGAKVGLASGVMLKFFQNYMHKPMKTLKFQDVDRGIRRQLGMYRMAGLSVGDSINNRMTLDEKFSFNDREVDKYKINIAIQNDSLTMYTFGMTDKELDDCSKILDFYAQKYYGVNYSSKLINRAVNSYSIDITFTNYNVITNFIMELSQKLCTKINMMNEKAIIPGRLSDAAEKNALDKEERNFSVPELSKSDVARILGQTGQHFISEAKGGCNWRKAGTSVFMGLIKNTLEKLTSIESTKYGIKQSRSNYGNSFLEFELKKLHYTEKINYVVGDKTASDNIALVNGRFLVTTHTGSESQEKIDKAFYEPMKLKIVRSNTGDAVVYSYIINSISEFELLINKLFSTKIKFNVFI